MKRTKNHQIVTSAAAALFLVTGSAFAVIDVLHQEDFTSNPGGSYSVLGGSSFSGASGFTGGFGNTTEDMDATADGVPGTSPSGAGSFQGSFGAQGAPSPETGTLRITDAGFLTDFATTYAGYASYSLGFAFYASVVPADFIITIGNGVDTYLFNALSQVSAGVWNDIWLNFSSGWIGSGSSIPTPLSGMTYMDITWSRNGTAAQQFYVDDITLLGNTSSSSSSSSSGGPSAVPEPNTVNLLGFVALMSLALRRFRGFDKGVAAA
ncbi:MAG TPA: PEP-CTERM sorting domain-containing protein [Kiritimatiellia bacterium]|nr:PEP-CTERM sorting domain-containing protein [Kiritimatiellia bacterium]HMP34761.1 PEP-CTERM sorting domain-containing protein [Kiritimatiellia bacterium]